MSILRTVLLVLCGALCAFPVPGFPDPVHEATRFLHVTGTPQDMDIESWRLNIRGRKVQQHLSLTYDDLLEMETVGKTVILVCPMVFTDRARWEGVPFSLILEKALVRDDYATIDFFGADGFSSRFTKEEAEGHLLFLALKVNGVTLPREHGFPARLVAEDVLGGKWVKWLTAIEIN